MKVSMLLVTVLSLLAMSNVAFAQYCVPGFQNAYQCSGNWQQQLYINPDCSQYWSNTQYCSSGCVNGFCSGTTTPSPTGCSISASLSTPPSIQSGDLATTTLTLSNSGGSGGTVNVNAYMCRTDGSNCFNIQCSSSSVFVPANSVAYDVCSSRNYYGYYPNSYPNVNPYNNPNYYPNYPNYYPNYPNGNMNNPYWYYPGNFRIRVDLNGCNLATTMYSGIFQIQTNQYCTPGNTNNYQCSGNVRQVQYQSSDCTTQWRDAETCTNGCSNGVCMTPTSTSTTVSTVTTTVTQQPQYALPDLGTVVIIIGFVILLLIFFLLVSERMGGRNHKVYSQPEYWRLSERFSGLGKFFSRFNYRKPEVC